jgi:hypothetical protein
VPDLQSDRLRGIVTGLECQRVIAKVGAERHQALGAVDRFDAEHPLCELRRALQVVGREANISQLL